MNPEIIAYGGWEKCLRLTNGVVELIATLEVGPRILRYGFVGGRNLFKEFDDTLGQTGGDEWLSYGGHRLWHAPEVMPRTYYPDNAPVRYDWDGATLTLTPPPESSNSLQLSMHVTLDPETSAVTVLHRIQNIGVWDVELAPWCLSVMAEGGRALFPQEPYIEHGDSFSAARRLILWHFANMADPRWIWGAKYVQLREDEHVDAKQKVGAMNTLGWAAYALDSELFIKRFPWIPGAEYPDLGCNCEFYTQPGMLEIESLGPLTRITPGASVTHEEKWSLHHVRVSTDEADIDAHVLPLI
jgi:hypothetical protein